MKASKRQLSAQLAIKWSELDSVSQRAGGFYKSFDIRPFGSLKWRHIDHPQPPLSSIQRRILRKVLESVVLPAGMLGGIPGRSLLDHAAAHVNKPLVVTLDIKDFFPSIDNERVYGVFSRRLGYSATLAATLTRLTTFRRYLPQGASTSAYLAALAAEELFVSLQRVCAPYGAVVTQYVDDLAISGNEGIRELVPKIIDEVTGHGFAISKRKIRVMPSRERQEVTGIVVNRGLSAGRERIQSILERILKTKDAASLLSRTYRSIHGQLSFVASLNSVQAERLRKYALICLPSVIVEDETLDAAERKERRSCSDISRSHYGDAVAD